MKESRGVHFKFSHRCHRIKSLSAITILSLTIRNDAQLEFEPLLAMARFRECDRISLYSGFSLFSPASAFLLPLPHSFTSSGTASPELPCQGTIYQERTPMEKKTCHLENMYQSGYGNLLSNFTLKHESPGECRTDNETNGQRQNRDCR